jgi:hypothetical protein
MTAEALLARQAGVITRGQALAAGLTRHAVDQRVRLRCWRPLHPQVYLVGGHARGPEAAVRAAVLWAGEGAVLDGPAAAWWHGLLAEPPPVVGVTRPRCRPAGRRPDVAVRRRDLDPVDVVAVRGLAVTGAPLTLLDTAVALGRPALLDRALHHGFDGGELQAAHERTRGSAGSASAGRLLAGAAERAAARARDRLAGLLGRGWVAQWPLPGGAVGPAHPAARIALLVDGWAGCPGAAPDEPLRRAGWTVLRIPATDVVRRPRAVLAAIDRAPDGRRPPSSPAAAHPARPGGCGGGAA